MPAFSTPPACPSPDGHRIVPDDQGRFVWGNGVISLAFEATADHPVSMIGMSGQGMTPTSPDGVAQRDAKPIVEISTPITGSNDNRLELAETLAGQQLRFDHARATTPPRHDDMTPYRLEITQTASFDALQPHGRTFGDEATEHTDSSPCPAQCPSGITVTSVFEAYPGVSAARTYTRISADAPFIVEAISSCNLTLPMDANDCDTEHATILWADSAWAVENDWHAAPLRDTTLRDRSFAINPGISSSVFARRSTSTWSTGTSQPDGVLELARLDRKPVCSVMWQIEHNGAWTWEIGENFPGLRVAAFGPEYRDHQWWTTVDPEHPFETVPVSFAIAAGDWQQANAEMTFQRRALRRAKAIELGRSNEFTHMQHTVVYNDYMNTLFGDPRLDKELPLIDGAAKVGADVFCIDAGWYDSTDGGWWNMVGEWQASDNRFGDMGLAGLAETIRVRGMGLGLWLEPEVVGIGSPLASSLPDEAFFMRHGVRVSDSGRYLLDFRSPAARDHVTRTVDRLIDEFGVVFFKFDYNTIPGVGTELNASSAGEGLLDHCRAYLDWLDDLRRRHPDVMIENCASGAMRADYAQLSRLDMQSTSDQCDPLVYAAIAAGAGLTILPEQQGNWGYAQQEMDDETAILTLAAGILGRLYLSGFLDRMDDNRLALVRDAIALHRTVLQSQQSLVPWWPAGLPDFNGDWLVAGLRPAANSNDDGYLTVWRRSGDASCSFALPDHVGLEQVFPNPDAPEHAPSAKPWSFTRGDDGMVTLTAGTTDVPSARIFRITR
ncbi:alpha-galactosidase [Bifidobacterium eulemuris]|uniref:Alpha-galactosidase n=2 Tax=Bifidobacterium eulemuris TaxID=1765219 RepID=A0A261GAZ4_9BIFI|nr:alpha-galactosidase [Bifidobacterium eulemuris]QOL32708.1 alpha-galactosidase [Bifidobacterium eulemuris]